jgi:hypothetical protein
MTMTRWRLVVQYMMICATFAVVVATTAVADAAPSRHEAATRMPTLSKTRPTTTTGSRKTSVMTVGTISNGATSSATALPLTGPVKAFDSANTISDAGWFTKAYAQGFRLYVLQAVNWSDCNPWSRTQPQIKMALNAGLKVGIYTRNPNCWKGGITATGPYRSQIQFFAIDVETDPGVPVTNAMVGGIAAMGVRPIVYSGYGMWPGVMGARNTSVSTVPLWDTNVTGTVTLANWSPSLGRPVPIPYGGWNTPTNPRIGVQQAFEISLNGVNVDLNTFDSSFLR